MSQNVINFVSLIAAFIGSPEVLIAVIFSLAGWIGHGAWSERRLKRKKSEGIDTSAATVLSESIPKTKLPDSSSDESISRENVKGAGPESGTISPRRVASELVQPAQRELMACIDEAKRDRWNCSGSIVWEGTRPNMEDWWHDFYDLKKFPGNEKVYDSILIQVKISVHLKFISIPPVLEILNWNGYFHAGESGIDGSWEWRTDGSPGQKNSVPAYDLDSLMKSFRSRIRSVTAQGAQAS